MPARVSQLSNYAVQMHDLQITRNPLAKEVIVIFNEVTRDHYQDAVITELGRVKKLAMVKKQLDMHYTQELGTPLMEDVDNPWEISLSITGFERFQRIPRMDDMISIDGVVYSIAEVRPANRSIEGILILTVYPERSSYVEDLGIVSITQRGEFIDILCKGNPVKIRAHIISHNARVATQWLDFKSILCVPGSVFKACYSVLSRWPVCSKVTVKGDDYIIENTDGAPQLYMVDGYVRCDEERRIFYTADGTDPNSDSPVFPGDLALGEWYDVEVMDADGNVATFFRYNLIQ